MTLHITLAINDETIGAVHITRQHDDNGTDPYAFNEYRWESERDRGWVLHRYGDGAVALAHQVLGEIVERHRIAVEAMGGDA